jgi:hypothetical protein
MIGRLRAGFSVSGRCASGIYARRRRIIQITSNPALISDLSPATKLADFCIFPPRMLWRGDDFFVTRGNVDRRRAWLKVGTRQQEPVAQA